MIRNERELSAAQNQILELERVLMDLKSTVSLQEFRLLARSSRPLIERLQSDILDYLTKPDLAPTQSISTNS
jgi:hypothetical protein